MNIPSADAARKPRVVVVDDTPLVFNSTSAPVSVMPWHPNDISEEGFSTALNDADVVVVDQQLYEAAERPKLPAPVDGLALVAVLQRHLAYSSPSKLVTFALFSGALHQLSTLPGTAQTHVIARAHGFEWAFPKGAGGDLTEISSALFSLAQATRATADAYASMGGRAYRRASALKGLLSIEADEVPWVDNAWNQVAASRPPITRTVEDTSGAVLLRWMLHRVLPYPTFLYDTAQVAARIGVTRPEMQSLADNELRELLEPVRYRGMLHDFLGPRYWKAGIEYVLQEISGDTSESSIVRRALVNQAGRNLRFVGHSRPVVALGFDMAPLDEPADPRDTVRIQPEDWPTFAEPARVLKSLAEDDADIYALVVPADRAAVVAPDESER